MKTKSAEIRSSVKQRRTRTDKKNFKKNEVMAKTQPSRYSHRCRAPLLDRVGWNGRENRRGKLGHHGRGGGQEKNSLDEINKLSSINLGIILKKNEFSTF